MVKVGIDVDGVISLLPWGLTPSQLTSVKEKRLYFFQKFKPAQKLYNHFVRKPNPVIRDLIKELYLERIGWVIISASNENYRRELEKWLEKNGFSGFEDLILKDNFNEDGREFKARVVPGFCNCYIEDRREIVAAIDERAGNKVRVIHYQQQTSEKLLEDIKFVDMYEAAWQQ